MGEGAWVGGWAKVGGGGAEAAGGKGRSGDGAKGGLLGRRRMMLEEKNVFAGDGRWEAVSGPREGVQRRKSWSM